MHPLLSVHAANRLICRDSLQDNLNTTFNTSGLINATEPEGIASIDGRAGLEIFSIELETAVVHSEVVTLTVLRVGFFASGVACDSLAWNRGEDDVSYGLGWQGKGINHGEG